ncbi:Pkinase-domain-containing protein [Serendipita vermifera]|nr:Pkinase-domain-containing protein [Serendipita vermifera]
MPSKSSLVPDFLGQLVDGGRLRLARILGSGAYGVCYEAHAVGEKEALRYAVKCILKTGLDQRQKLFQQRELGLHAAASTHPGIVTLHRIFEESGCVFLVMDLAEGDLFSMITEHYLYLGRDALIRHVFCQIVDALDYCHRKGIYHRDLKPENILCVNAGAKVMLSDFGLATNEPISRDLGCGSSYYMSPECYGGVFQKVESYAPRQNDIWALGIILVNLTCGRNPWRQASPADETFRTFVHDPDFLPSILPVSSDCNEILKRIFTINPQNRISLPELRQSIRAVTRFTMTNEELKMAPEACKAAARAAWSEAQKVAKRKPAIVPPIIIEEHPPVGVAYSARQGHVLVDSTSGISSSAGPEHTSASHHETRPPTSLTSITPDPSGSIQGSPRAPAASTNSLSASSAAESSGPTTPEWNPNADGTVNLPDVNEEPLVLDLLNEPQIATQQITVPKPGEHHANKPGELVKTAQASPVRGVKELWRKVRF